jgi:dTDP-4-dehydrorhamnose reductase
MARIAILGSTGMLGLTLTKVLEKKADKIYEFNRAGKSVTGNNETKIFNIDEESSGIEILRRTSFDYVLNCIGMIKQVIRETDENSVRLAHLLNHDFPSKLNEYGQSEGTPIIQIGTDCVFSGRTGSYSEEDQQDPIDLYGFTKSLGEKSTNATMLIRCSIIGKELHSNNSLLEWVLSQPKGVTVNGFTNHLWNGVTTLHFAKIVSSIIQYGNYKPGVSHLVPKDTVTKFDLLNLICKYFGRDDLEIIPCQTEIPINRSLITTNSKRVLQLWRDAGYNEIPTIAEMVEEYSKWC